MAVGTPQQQRPAACEPVREEQTSLPSVSHENTAHLRVYPTHPLPDSVLWGLDITVSMTVSITSGCSYSMGW